MEYLVVYEQSQDGWGAYVPDLPGLGVVGDTFEEVQQLITDGITFRSRNMAILFLSRQPGLHIFRSLKVSPNPSRRSDDTCG
jgi:hypothetical protein